MKTDHHVAPDPLRLVFHHRPLRVRQPVQPVHDPVDQTDSGRSQRIGTIGKGDLPVQLRSLLPRRREPLLQNSTKALEGFVLTLTQAHRLRQLPEDTRRMWQSGLLKRRLHRFFRIGGLRGVGRPKILRLKPASDALGGGIPAQTTVHFSGITPYPHLQFGIDDQTPSPPIPARLL